MRSCEGLPGDGNNKDVALESVSLICNELPESNIGWPLRGCNRAIKRSKERNMSTMEWVMHLPNRSSQALEHNQVDTKIAKETNSEDLSTYSAVTDRSKQSGTDWPFLHVNTSTVSDYSSSISYESTPATSRSQSDLALKEVKTPVKRELQCKSTFLECKQFSYEELERATHKFSPENLIGEGGCSTVYKGHLPSGKLVAVKFLKQYKEAWNDFLLEVDITSSLMHKYIPPLIGVCIEDNHLILVYDFLPKGSLEERLHSEKTKSVLSWKVRFKVAVAIAEALNYLHNECSPPIIHRDVKSSNVLLSADFEPKLSDFGLALWGRRDSSCMIHSDVLGTFGYIAPEYFMHGWVSNKIDIFSFGVLLLELLTGKKPVGSDDLKVQGSLIKWAMPLLETGNVDALLDPKLGRKFNIVEVQRMITAATLCTKLSPQARPRVSQILKLLRGEEKEMKIMNSCSKELDAKSNDHEVNDLFPGFWYNYKPSLDLSRLDLETAVESRRKSLERKRLKLKDYLEQQQD